MAQFEILVYHDEYSLKHINCIRKLIGILDGSIVKETIDSFKVDVPESNMDLVKDLGSNGYLVIVEDLE